MNKPTIITREEFEKTERMRDLYDTMIMYPVMFCIIFGLPIVGLIYQEGGFINGSLIILAICSVLGPYLYVLTKKHENCLDVIKEYCRYEEARRQEERHKAREMERERRSTKREVPKEIQEREIEKRKRRQEAINNPLSRTKLIFHGGCLSCNTPTVSGIGTCTGCKYFECDWAKPDLSAQYQFNLN